MKTKMMIAMAFMAMMATSAMAQQQSRGMKRMDSRSSVECKMMRQDMRGGKGRDMRGQFSPKAKAMQKRHFQRQMACSGCRDARFCQGGRDCFHGHHHHHHHDKMVVIRI